jgi:hypothetical protein
MTTDIQDLLLKNYLVKHEIDGIPNMAQQMDNIPLFRWITIILCIMVVVLLFLLLYFGYKFGIKQNRFRHSWLLLGFYLISVLNLLCYVFAQIFILRAFNYANDFFKALDL